MKRFVIFLVLVCFNISSVAYAIGPQYQRHHIKTRVISKKPLETNKTLLPNPVNTAQILQQGEIAEVDGIFFDVVAANKLKKHIELLMVKARESELLKQKIDLLLQKIKIEQQTNNLDARTVQEYKNYTQLIEQRLEKAEKKANSPWRNPFLMILIGLVGGLAAGMGISK